MRVRAAFVERSTGEILLGPPKSRAGRRVVGIPQVIIPLLREHPSIFVKDEPGALVFPGVMGGPLRRANFNKMSAWPYAGEVDRRRGPAFPRFAPYGEHLRSGQRRGAAGSHGQDGSRQRASGHDLPAEARGADQAITNAIDSHVQAEQRGDEDDDGQPGALAPVS